MSELLPDSWTTAPIGALTVDTSQRVPAENDEFTYIDISSVDREKKRILTPQQLLGKDAPSRARKVVQSGDVLVSMTRPNLNAVAYVSSDLDGQIASTGFDVLRSPSLDPRWLFYLVRCGDFVEAMSSLVQGALYPAIRSKDVRDFVAPLAPLKEQRRIADKLDAVLKRVDACRERLDRVPLILKRFREAVLAAATSGALTEELRERNPHSPVSSHHFLPEMKPLNEGELGPEIPQYWQWVSIKEIAEVKGGKRLPVGESLSPNNTGQPYIRATNLKSGTVAGELRYVPEHLKSKISRYIVRAGDAYITIVGACIGDAGVIPVHLDGANLTENAARIRGSGRCLSSFIAIWLRSPICQKQILINKYSAAQGKLALFRIEEMPIPLPPLEEQHEIVRRVQKLFAFADRLEARYATGRKQVDQLTPSLLAKAFRGELVEQDPNDEPASVLLEQIKAERAGQPGKKQKRGRKSKP